MTIEDPIAITLIGAGPWSYKVKTALESKGVSVNQISYRSFEFMTREEINSHVSGSIVWSCTTPKNQLRVMKLIAHLQAKVLLEKPIATSNNESIEFEQIVDKSNNTFFISQIWKYSEIWQQIKKASDLGNTSSIFIERFGSNRRKYLSPPQDWLSHDLYLLYDLYGKKLRDSEICKVFLPSSDVLQCKIDLKKGPEINMIGGLKNGQRVMRWTVSDNFSDTVTDFLTNSITSINKISKIQTVTNLISENLILRMVEDVNKSTEIIDLNFILWLYRKLLL